MSLSLPSNLGNDNPCVVKALQRAPWASEHIEMDEDLYTQWINIPPEEPRPLNQYALLGLPLFCSDRDTIENATRNQLDKLDRYALVGDPRKREACQGMMDEVAEARTILIKTDERKAYNKRFLEEHGYSQGFIDAILEKDCEFAPDSSKDFSDAKEDNYTRWLDLAPRPRPPDFYALLGLPLYCRDSRRIEAGMKTQLGKLNRFKAEASPSQRFACNEKKDEVVGAARVLVNQRERKAYNRKLLQSRGYLPAMIDAIVERDCELGSVDEPVVSSVAFEPQEATPSETVVEPQFDYSTTDRTVRHRPKRSIAKILSTVIAVIVPLTIFSALIWKFQSQASLQRDREPAKPTVAPIVEEIDQERKRSEGSSSAQSKVTPDQDKEATHQTPPPDKPVPTEEREPWSKIRDVVAAGQYERSNRIGGGGGGPFSDVPAEGAILTGFRTTQSTFYGGHLTIKSLQPIFESKNGRVPGKIHGHPHGATIQIEARPGYAVGAVSASSGYRVDGFSVLFMRIKGGELDPEDTYESKWVGGRGGGRSSIVYKSGTLAIGIFGHQGADLDGFGIVRADIVPAQPGPRQQVGVVKTPPAKLILISPLSKAVKADIGILANKRRLANNRDYTWSNVPEELVGMNVLRMEVRADGSYAVSCDGVGQVYLLVVEVAGGELISQGWERTKMRVGIITRRGTKPVMSVTVWKQTLSGGGTFVIRNTGNYSYMMASRIQMKLHR